MDKIFKTIYVLATLIYIEMFFFPNLLDGIKLQNCSLLHICVWPLSLILFVSLLKVKIFSNATFHILSLFLRLLHCVFFPYFCFFFFILPPLHVITILFLVGFLNAAVKMPFEDQCCRNRWTILHPFGVKQFFAFNSEIFYILALLVYFSHSAHTHTRISLTTCLTDWVDLKIMFMVKLRQKKEEGNILLKEREHRIPK